MKIRAAVPSDAAGIRRVIRPEIEEGVANFGTTVPSVAQVQADVASDDRYPWLVAVSDDGAVLGFAKASAWKRREGYRWTSEIGVYIAADAQGQGLGTALVQELITACRDVGLVSLIAGIALPNPASVGLFEGQGFVKVGVFVKNGFKAGSWHDVGYWARHLRPDEPPGP